MAGGTYGILMTLGWAFLAGILPLYAAALTMRLGFDLRKIDGDDRSGRLLIVLPLAAILWLVLGQALARRISGGDDGGWLETVLLFGPVLAAFAVVTVLAFGRRGVAGMAANAGQVAVLNVVAAAAFFPTAIYFRHFAQL